MFPGSCAFLTQETWFIPDPNPDPAKSSGSDRIRIHNTVMQGAVAISFSLQASSFCFLCSHFAAGQSQIAERNNDFNEAVKRVAFPNVSRQLLTLFFNRPSAVGMDLMFAVILYI